ncbi:MAG: hypothetical protein NZ949_07810, partial [Candidatus Kapabacteria bacterium]|nr:hypothetical protein [Candidatus Kapabacteria bacterium]
RRGGKLADMVKVRLPSQAGAFYAQDSGSVAPPRRAIAVIGVKLGGCGRRRVRAAVKMSTAIMNPRFPDVTRPHIPIAGFALYAMAHSALQNY